MDRKQWHDEGKGLQEELEAYNWEYRFKICSKCPLSEQKRRKCLRPKDGKVRMIKGKKIHETYCDWLVKARTKKFRNKIISYINMGFRMNGF